MSDALVGLLEATELRSIRCTLHQSESELNSARDEMPPLGANVDEWISKTDLADDGITFTHHFHLRLQDEKRVVTGFEVHLHHDAWFTWIGEPYLAEPEVLRDFGYSIALLAIYPYVRHAAQAAAAAAGYDGLVLPLKRNLRPSGGDEEE